MIGFLGFDDALNRLLVSAYGERAMAIVSVYRAPDGELHLGFVAPDGKLHIDPPELPPDLFLTEDERQAGLGAFVFSLRAGDNVGVVEIHGKLHRLPLLHWYAPPYSAVPPPDTRPDRDQDGRPILIDEDRFEAWLSMSNVLEVLSAKEPVAQSPTAEATAVPEPSRRGRKPKYDWAAFYREIVCVANEPDGLPEIQADLESRMTEWCEANWDEVPVESMIRTHVSMVYRELREGRK